MTGAEYLRQWKRANPDKVREYRRRYAKTESFRTYQAAWKKAERQWPKREAVLAKGRARYARDRDKIIAAKRGGGAGLTPKELATLLKRAKGKCAICAKPHKRLVIDHDHTTRRVRGVLCIGCNTFVGYLEKRGALLERARKYMKETK